MKFAVTADIHFHNYSENAKLLKDGTNSRLQDIIDAFNWMVDKAVEEGCVWLLIAGDLWHNRKSLPVDLSHRVYETMEAASKRIQIACLLGNHDMSVNGDGTHSLTQMRGIMRVMDKPSFDSASGGTAWLPYTESPEEVRKFVKKYANKDTTLIGHLGIGDPKFADCVPTDYEIPGKISVSDLAPEKWRYVFLGHYHSHQQLAPNMWYVGSPLQLSYKEAGQLKGFFIVDTRKSLDFHENTLSPKFHTLNEQERDLFKRISKKDFVRIKVRSKDAKARFIAETGGRENLRFDVLPNTDNTVRLTKTEKGDKFLLDEFAQIANVPSSAREAVVAVGLELLRKAEEK